MTEPSDTDLILRMQRTAHAINTGARHDSLLYELRAELEEMIEEWKKRCTPISEAEWHRDPVRIFSWDRARVPVPYHMVVNLHVRHQTLYGMAGNFSLQQWQDADWFSIRSN